MIETILDWAGTVLIIIGCGFLTSKRASDPSLRYKTLWLFLCSNLLWIPLGLFLGAYGLFLTQCILMSFNVRGIILCKKEMIA